MEEPLPRHNGINVSFRRGGWNKVGSFNLKITPLNKKTPDGMNSPGTQPEIGFFRPYPNAVPLD